MKYTIQQNSIDWNIKELTEEKNLGVLTKCTVKVKRQRHEAASKANRVMGVFKDLNWKSFQITYKGFIRLHLKHAILGAYIRRGI